MKLNLLSDVTSQALVVSLQGTAARQAAIADNIANVDTPGFTRSDVEFEAALANALRGAARARHFGAPAFGAPSADLPAVSVRRVKDSAAPARADGNNVDVEREMTELARNALASRAGSEMLGARIRMLRAVIGQGRR